MKVLFYLATRFPIPASGGREKMILQTLSFFKDCRIVFFVPKKFVDKSCDEIACASLLGVSEVVFVSSPSLLEVFWNVLLKGYSFQESMFYSRSGCIAIDKFSLKYKPDIVVFDMLRMATYENSLSAATKVLEIDDLLSLRYKRMVEVRSSDFNILGTFSNYYNRFFSTFSDKYLTKYFLRIEGFLISRSEIRAAKQFVYINFVSEAEANLYKAKVGGAVKCFSVPPTVTTRRLLGKEGLGVVLGFVGNLRTNQNLNSFEYIVNKILPHIKSDYRYHVVGDFDERAERIARIHPNVVLKGFVENIEDEICKIDILLAPITFGTGIKLKILDGLSFGLPVLTNNVGIEGILGESGVHYIVENDPLKMANCVDDLISDPEARLRIGESALHLAEAFYSPGLNRAKYREFIGVEDGK